jgi:replication-associated recombination protein RarA
LYKPKLKDDIPYDQVVSALQKMIRRDMERGALVLGETLFENNFGGALARRLMSIAAEDIGLANPQLVAQVYALCAGWTIAKKESKGGHGEFLALAMCIILLCRSPKNREVDDAIVVTNRRMKEGLDSASKVIADHRELCVDSHTDEGKVMLRQKAAANATKYEDEAWRQFYTEGALLRGHVEVNGNPWGREAANLYGFDYRAYLRGYVADDKEKQAKVETST